MRRSFVLLALVLLSAPCVLAQVDDDEFAPDSFPAAAPAEVAGGMRPSEDVFVSAVLPQNPVNRTFAAGSIIEVVLGFENRGEVPMNVTGLQCSLMYEWVQHVQNYSVAQENTIVEPGSMASIVYRFRPDPSIEPHEFGILGQVFYQDSNGNYYSSIFHNQTIHLTEAEDEANYAQMIMTTGALAATAFGIWWILQEDPRKSSSRKPRAASSKSPVEMGTTSKASASDWLVGTAASPSKKRAAGKR